MTHGQNKNVTQHFKNTNIPKQFQTVVTVFSRLVYFSSILRYVKVPGDACYGGDEKKYEPRIMMCPIPSKFFLRLIQDTKSFSR